MLWWTLRKLESEDPEKRLQAVDELRRTGGREAAEHLVRTLSDPDVRVRDGAGEALAAIGGPQMVDVCIATLLTSENLTARLNAARALGFLGDPTATGVLSDRLARDPHPAIRQVAGLSLAALGWAPSSTDERIRLAMARGAWAEAAAEGPAAVEYLLDVVFDSPWYLRDGLDAALAEIGEPALRALDAGPETHEGWDAFAENAVAVRQTWRKLAERVHELRNERRAFDTREIRTERRSTLNIATDLGAHLADPNTGERFGGGPRDALGRFRGLCHECPRCGVEESGSLTIDDVARECLTRDQRLAPCRTCGAYYLVPATVFAPGCLQALAENTHRLAAFLAEMPYHKVLVPDWGVALFQANALAPDDPANLPWDGADPCPLCRSVADRPAKVVRLHCRGCRTELRLRPTDISRSAETLVRCKRCGSPTLIPPRVWCSTCGRGLLPQPVLVKLTIGVG